jgi:hypothetical protein
MIIMIRYISCKEWQIYDYQKYTCHVTLVEKPPFPTIGSTCPQL